MTDTLPTPPPPGPTMSDLFHYKTANASFNYQVEHTVDESGNFLNYKLFTNQSHPLSTTAVIDHIPAHLHVNEYNDVFIIDSVFSGIGRTNRDFYNVVIKPVFYDLKVTDYKYFKTENEEAIANIVNNDITKNTSIIILGGDTSVFEIVNTALKNAKVSPHKINFAILPFGTGNAFAYSSGYSNELVGFTKLFNDKITHLPIYKVSFPEGSTDRRGKSVSSLFFLVVVSWGIHVDLVIEADSPELRPYGVNRFKMAFQKIFQRPEWKYHGELYNETGTLVKKGNNLYTNIIALPLVENNYMISPASKATENKLHLLNIPDELERPEFAQLLFAPYQEGAHVRHPKVFYQDVGKGVNFRFDQDGVRICVDGEIIDIKESIGKEVKVEVIGQDHINFGVIGVE